MRTFDILDPKEPLFGAKMLEASAGTGKTFAIEHLVVRLLLESEVEIEEILAITYTRAAARDMRMRICENIKQASKALVNGECKWPYLSKYLGSKEAIYKLNDALTRFDRAQIFTIHGFCQRMLSEFSLEARSLQPQEKEVLPLGKALIGDLLDFLEAQEALCPEQMQELVKSKTLSRLCKDLLNQPFVSSQNTLQEDFLQIEETIRKAPSMHPQVEEAFFGLEEACKYSDYSQGEIREQLEALKELFENPSSQQAMRKLFAWKGSIFSFVSPQNRKKKKESIEQPAVFEWAISHLQPLILAAMEPKTLFHRLRFAWQAPFEELLEERGLFSPEFLLEKMKRSLVHTDFVANIQNRYQAVIIDEFQDTDATQWLIFSTLFSTLSLFYLVGDPKQSIYRFRNADLYTYYSARDQLGVEATCSLNTNYRSSPKLLSALNDFFGEAHVHPWLWLPGENRVEPYQPVQAGVCDSGDLNDGRHPLQFFRVGNLREEAYAYIVREIERLKPHMSSYGSFAILVQSNQQASQIQEYLEGRSLPAIAKSKGSLGKSLAMQTLEELFNALYFPRDASAIRLFLAGPLINDPFASIADLPLLFSWKEALSQGGMAAFFREFLASSWKKSESFAEKIALCGTAFSNDFYQLLEMLMIKNPGSYEEIARFFCEIEEGDPDEDGSIRRKIEGGEDAIQILTMHTSKGLEFDVVFALGVAMATPPSQEEPEEAEAEKLRQLYVALTRAKKRLYIPLASQKIKERGEPPLELLWKRSKLIADGSDPVQKLVELNPYIGVELFEPAQLISTVAEKKEHIFTTEEPFLFPRPPGMIYSYSSLSKQEKGDPLEPLKEGKTIHTLPRGSEVGVLFHKIFERIFTESKEIEAILEEELSLSKLSEWKEVVFDSVKNALSIPLFDSVCLLDLDRSKVRAEVEFFFHEAPHFYKGCIDLLFLWDGRIYFLDWKTNWLGQDETSYSEENLCRAMDEHNYWLQASLYADALQRAWPNVPFGKAIYLFLRGGVFTFEPKPFRTV